MERKYYILDTILLISILLIEIGNFSITKLYNFFKFFYIYFQHLFSILQFIMLQLFCLHQYFAVNLELQNCSQKLWLAQKNILIFLALIYPSLGSSELSRVSVIQLITFFQCTCILFKTLVDNISCMHQNQNPVIPLLSKYTLDSSVYFKYFFIMKIHRFVGKKNFVLVFKNFSLYTCLPLSSILVSAQVLSQTELYLFNKLSSLIKNISNQFSYHNCLHTHSSHEALYVMVQFYNYHTSNQ